MKTIKYIKCDNDILSYIVHMHAYKGEQFYTHNYIDKKVDSYIIKIAVFMGNVS